MCTKEDRSYPSEAQVIVSDHIHNPKRNTVQSE